MDRQLVDGKKNKRTGEPGALVTIPEALRPRETNQICGSEVRKVRIRFVRPAIDRSSQGRQHGVLVHDPMSTAISLDLLRVYGEKDRLGNPTWLLADLS